MRYYLFTIQHNKEKNAENRPATLGFNTRDEAIAAWHEQRKNDMRNSTLDWAFSMVINSEMGVEEYEKSGREYVPEPEIEAEA